MTNHPNRNKRPLSAKDVRAMFAAEDKSAQHTMTEQQAKHTPGPWRAVDFHNKPWTDALTIGYGPDPNFAYAESGIIAYTTRGFEGSYDKNGVHDERGCAWANARLIAAAPELLTMLKWLYEYGCQHDFDLHYPDFPLLQIDKLLAKAEGR